MAKRDFLFELGTEELPPKSLFTLAQALRRRHRERSGSCRDRSTARSSGSRRRAGSQCACMACPNGNRIRRSSGKDPQSRTRSTRTDSRPRQRRDSPRRAASVSMSCSRSMAPKGRVLMFVGTKKGEPTPALLPGIVKAALDALPIAKRMRWGAGDARVRSARALGSHAVRHDCRRLRDSRRAHGQALARTSLPRTRAAADRESGEIPASAEEGPRPGERRRSPRAHTQRSGRARSSRPAVTLLSRTPCSMK